MCIAVARHWHAAAIFWTSYTCPMPFTREASNDLDVMAPPGEQTFVDAPRMAARSVALMEKRRQAKAAQAKMQEPARTKRELWADIMTDDEDTFPSWTPSPSRPQQQLKVAPPAPQTTQEAEGLSWDPLGLGSAETDATDLQMPRTKTLPQKAGFDKLSWSTAATDSVETEQTDEAGSVSELSTTEASWSQDECGEQAAQPVQQVLMPMQLPMQLPMQQMAGVPMMQMPQVPHVQQVPMQQVQMQAPMQVQQPRVMVAVPMQMQQPSVVGMGMLPFVMPLNGTNFSGVPHLQYPAQQQQQQHQQHQQQQQQQTQSWQQEQEEEEQIVPAGPPSGKSHRFHQKNSSMGILSSDARTFTKRYNKGRLSIICENKVHFHGSVRYAVRFTEGELCSADGVGFILSSDLPCTRNIQKIVSIFANRTGRICVRVHEEVERCQQRVKCLEIGDWLEVGADLVNQTVSFTVWPQDGSAPSFATVSFKDILKQARGKVNGLPRNPCGFLAVVVKHVGVSVNFGS
ncbi:unnamed protein product [Effrenium voratum]|uniref:Uncharacterized protein n=1 Tax=Effrenium voratum TaxID=2562239 RepID=A0AA36J8A6_9DINO|nr:unnamed protein product [Effrenium voratum]